MIDRIYFVFPEDTTLDFDVSLTMFETFCDFVYKKNSKIRAMRDIEYIFEDKRLVVRRSIVNKKFLEYWAEFKTEFGRVDELIDE